MAKIRIGNVEQFLPQFKQMAHWLSQGDYRTVDRADLVQAAATHFLRTRSRYNPELSSWKTYVLSRARTVMMDEIRRVTHRGRTAAVLLGPGTPDKKVRQPSDFWGAIQRIVGDRATFVLSSYYRDGFKQNEIARALCMTPSSICRIIHKAHKKLKMDLKVA